MTQPQHVRQCPRCLKLVEHADLVVFEAGDLYHQNCFVQNGGAYTLVSAYLHRQKPASFCHSCLATALHISYEETRKIVTALRVDHNFVVLLGAQCAACRRLRVTVQAVGESAL